MADYHVISKPYPQVDALSKVTGRREYMSDIRLPGMLWGQVVRSPYAHGRILRIDTRKASRVSGVVAIITADDTPGIPCGPAIPDWEILPREKVVYVGQPVAAIAALHPEAAEEAAGLIHMDLEELPAVFDPREAMAPGAPLIHKEKDRNIALTYRVDKGNVQEAFEKSDYIRELTYYPSTQFHAPMEPNGAIASYDPLRGQYTLRVATQTPYLAWVLYSRALGIERDKLRLIQSPMGGAFGGKFENNYHLIAACLARKAERPVRLINTYAEEFLTSPLRLPMEIHMKMGIRKDGTITAKEMVVVGDNGAFTYRGPAVVATVCLRMDNLYRIPNCKATGYLVYTNNVPKSACRGFGQPEVLFGAEGLLDMLAEDAGMDPGHLRIKNSFQKGEKTIHGWVIGSCGLSECIEKAQKKSQWQEKRKAYASQRGSMRRGIGLSCCNHVSGYRPILREFDGSAAMVRIGPDGHIILFTGEVDMGQGYSTVAAQCAAEELGVPLDWIQVAPVDSENSILGIGSLASRATVLGGNAVRIAASQAREMVLKAAGSLLGRDPGSLRFVNGNLKDKGSGETIRAFRDLIADLANVQTGQPFIGLGSYVPATVLPDPETQYGNPSPSYPFAAHVAEVEVDTETGQVRVICYVAANDVGKAINPLLVRGQLEGGVVQGIGYALTEKVIFHQGHMVYRNLTDYKVPTIFEAPPIETEIIEEEDPNGPYGAKSVGEAALDPVVAAIANAIYNAVGVRMTKLPITPESLLRAITNGRTGQKITGPP